ncbi:MAG: hypothetical protein OHK0046_28100 [Anaerolineae bacterium]
MTMSDNSVFISYRRSVSSFIARAVFQDLRYHQFDVFMDVESIDSGAFDTIILNQIAARTHFIVILTPGAVERCSEPDDWLRREIETAIDVERNIVPLMVNGFTFQQAEQYLTGKLAQLGRYNALNVPHDFFDEAMNRLRTRFLKPPQTAIPLQPVPLTDAPVVQQKIVIATRQAAPTEAELSSEEYYDRGQQKWENADYGSAIKDCTRAIDLNPRFSEAYNRRGSAYLGLDQYDNAMADFRSAIEIDPSYPAPHFNLGLSYAALGNYKQAKAHYEEALRLNPTFAQAYYSRALAKTALNDYRGAVDDYEKFLELGGGAHFDNMDEVTGTIASLRKKLQG